MSRATSRTSYCGASASEATPAPAAKMRISAPETRRMPRATRGAPSPRVSGDRDGREPHRPRARREPRDGDEDERGAERVGRPRRATGAPNTIANTVTAALGIIASDTFRCALVTSFGWSCCYQLAVGSWAAGVVFFSPRLLSVSML